MSSGTVSGAVAPALRLATVRRSDSLWREAWRRFRRHRLAMLGGLVLAAMVVAVLAGPFVYRVPIDEIAFKAKLTGPSRAHPLGTDDLGRDLLSRIIYGSRVSLFVGVVTVGVATVAGVVLGLLAGYYGRWVDMLVMRYIDLQWAFPNFIIAVGLVAVFGTGLLNVLVAVTLAYVDDFARITRGMVLALREEEFVVAARAVGTSDARIMFREILPNALSPILVQATVGVSYAILAEAALSFLGLGVKPATPTWGLILSDARPFFVEAWWLGIFPGLAIMLAVLSINFLGDGLGDLLNVKESQGIGA